MSRRDTLAERILRFNQQLAEVSLELPEGFSLLNPFTGPRSGLVQAVTTAFYHKFYDDDRPRRLILGSSPARRGTAVTGVPFADAELLETETDIDIDGYAIQPTSSGFLSDVIEGYGGHGRFYSDFIMSFVCPLGVVRTKPTGGEVNANYYDTKKLEHGLRPFIVDATKSQVAFGLDTSECYCIGSGENFRFLTTLNAEEGLFDHIVPLEHPRFITQYNPTRKEEYVEKYLRVLRREGMATTATISHP
jgi:hypothetical protein